MNLSSLISEVIIRDSASIQLERVAMALGHVRQASTEAAGGVNTFEQNLVKSSRGIERAAREFEGLKRASDDVYAAQVRLADIQVKLDNAVAKGVATDIEAKQVYADMAAKINGTKDAANALATEMEHLRAKFDPAFASAQKLNAELSDLARLEASGTTSTAVLAAALDHLVLKYDETARSAHAAAKAQEEFMAAARAANAIAVSQAHFNSLSGAGAIDNFPATSRGASFSALNERAELDELRKTFDQTYAAAKNLEEGLANLARLEAAGIQITGGYAAAISALNLKYDETARSAHAAAKAQEEFMAAARAANAIAVSQAHFNNLSGAGAIDNFPATSRGATFSALSERAELDELRQKYDQTYASAVKLEEEIADLARLEAAGVQITGGYAAAIASLNLKYDETARKAHEAARAQEEFIVSMRAANSAAASQAHFNSLSGAGAIDNFPATSRGATFSALDERAELDELRQKYDQTYAAAQNLEQEFDDLARLEAAGIQITGGYTAAFDALIIKYSAAAAAARDLTQAQIDMIATARAANDAAVAQAHFNNLTGAGALNILPATAYGAGFEALAGREALAAEKEKRQSVGFMGLSSPSTGAYAGMKSNVDANEKLKKGFADLAEGGKKAGDVARLTSRDFMVLSYQLNDIATMAAMGASPFMIIASQGGQIFQVFQQGGGVIASLKQVGGLIASWITPITAVVAGLISIGVVGVASWVSWINQQDKLAASLEGVGRATGVTLDGLNKVASAGARVAGISQGQGRDLASQYAGSGAFSSDMVEKLIGTTKNYARITGTDLMTAGTSLTQAFADPAKGAQELDKRLGFLTAAQKDYIRSLRDSGETQKAQNVLFADYEKAVQKSADRTWSIVRAWQQGVVAVKDFFGEIGHQIDKTVNGPSAQEQIDALTNRQVAGGRGRPGVSQSVTPLGNEAAAKIRELQKQIDRANDEAAVQASLQKSRNLGDQASSAIATAAPEQARLRGIKEQLDLVAKALADPDSGYVGGAEAAKLATDRLAGAYKSLTDASGKVLTNSDLATEKFNIEVASINARTLANRQAIAVMQAESSARGKLMTDIERQTAALQAQTLEAERAKRASQDILIEQQKSSALTGLREFPRTQTEIDQEFTQHRKTQRDNAALRQAEALVKQKAAYEAIQAPLQAMNDNLAIQNVMLDTQIATFGQSEGAVAKAAALQSMLNDAARAGISVNGDLRKTYEELAGRIGEYTQRQYDANEVQQKIIENADKTRGAFKSLFGEIAHGLAEGKSGKDIFKGILAKVSTNLIDSGIQGLSDSMLDKEGKPLGGPLGGMLSKLLGAGGKKGDSVANPLWVAVAGGFGIPALGNSGLTIGAPGITGGAITGGAITAITGGAVNAPASAAPASAAAASAVIRPGSITSMPLAGLGGQQYPNGGGPGNSFVGALSLAGEFPSTPGWGVADISHSRGIRNNNPGNIEDGPWARLQPGYLGGDGRFARFSTPEQGFANMQNLLKKNYLGRGLNTPSSIINKYAPPGENNSSSYAGRVAAGLGIGVNDRIDPNDPSQVQALALQMAALENGGSISPWLNRNGVVNPVAKSSAMRRGGSDSDLISGNIGSDSILGGAYNDNLRGSSRTSFVNAAGQIVWPGPTTAFSRGTRNNNPGNINDGAWARDQLGYVGPESGKRRFATFDTPEHGFTAMQALLAKYGDKGIDTPYKLLSKYAPPSENDTAGYAKQVASWGGFSGPDQKLNMRDPETLRNLSYAMGRFENGKPISGWLSQNGGADLDNKNNLSVKQVPGSLDRLTASITKVQTAATQTVPALDGAAQGTLNFGGSLSSLGSLIGGKSGSPAGSAIGSGIGQLLSLFMGLIKIPGFAEGTDFAPGGMALVGERGPELLRLPRGSSVTPNHLLNRGNSSQSSGTAIRLGDTNINVAGSVDEQTLNRIKLEIKASEERTKSHVARNFPAYQGAYSNGFG